MWATISLRSSASMTIVRNLKIRKDRSCAPIRRCRKKIGPALSTEMTAAMTRSTGKQDKENDGRDEDVHHPLHQLGRRTQSARGGKHKTGTPSIELMLVEAPISSK